MAWAELSDVRLYYELIGQGDPVLLIPGLGTTCRLWDPIAPDLAEHFSLILPDNRGIGQSVGRKHAKHLQDYVVDLVELLDKLQLERAHIVGLSLGGIIAQRFAMDHSSRVDRLVLISCAHQFGPYLRGMAMLLAQSMRHFPWELYQRTIELLGTAPAYYDAHPSKVEEKIAAARACPISRMAVVRQLQCLHSSEVEPGDYQITAPTLVIAGEHDALIPSCFSREMARQIPGSEFWVVPGGGHNPAAEFPEVVVPRIVKFLNRREDEVLTMKEVPTFSTRVGLLG
jgi:pimeloyl-ACP methyl ester carboxylesterase